MSTIKLEELIKEWETEGIYQCSISTWVNGDPDYGSTASNISEWWLPRIKNLLSQQAEEYAEQIGNECTKAAENYGSNSIYFVLGASLAITLIKELYKKYE